MSAVAQEQSDAEPLLKPGDELVYVNRSPRLKTALQVFRGTGENKDPLMWESAIGPVPACVLPGTYDQSACLVHAQQMAVESGLQIGDWFRDVEGNLHVNMVRSR